jgi:hypothetical protein
MFTTNFENGVLTVIKDTNIIIVQPFKPTSTGIQQSWAYEQEAIEWWNSIKHLYDYELPTETVESTPNN